MMDSKNYAEVLIDGNVYTLAGTEEKSYFQKVAGYINDKIEKLREQPGFGKQSADYQRVMIELNMADDYFKALDQVSAMEHQKNEMEREIYSLKHELVSTQMKLESALRTLDALQKEQSLYQEEKEQPEIPEADTAEKKGPSGDEAEDSREAEPAVPPVRPSQKGGHGVRRGGKR